MEKLIHTAVSKALLQRPARRNDGMLWVSDLGRNPYATFRRLLTGELEPFDYPVQLMMDAGSAIEGYTLRQVAENLERNIRTQFPLFNDVWSGYADLVIGHGTKDVIIYDHKASCGKWWDYKDSLPRSADCCQVWMYGQLYRAMFGIAPRIGLYYRGWGSWAEFEIVDDGTYLQAIGVVTDEKGIEEYEVARERQVSPDLLCDELEGFYHLIKLGQFKIADFEVMTPPPDPEWDYAETATERLRS